MARKKLKGRVPTYQTCCGCGAVFAFGDDTAHTAEQCIERVSTKLAMLLQDRKESSGDRSVYKACIVWPMKHEAFDTTDDHLLNVRAVANMTHPNQKGGES